MSGPPVASRAASGPLGALSIEDVAAAFCTAVVDEPAEDAAPRVLRWALSVWAAGVDEAPLALIHDLGFVLLRGRGTRFCAARDRAFASGTAAADDDDDDVRRGVRASRLAWEDRVVAAWLNDPAILAAHVVIAGLPTNAQEAAIPHAIAAALARGLPVGSHPGHNVGALRTLLLRLASERFTGEADVVARASGSARGLEPVASAAAVLDALRPLLAGRALLKEEDLWELAHLDDVPSEAARLALRTVHRIMARIGPPASSTLSRLQRRSRDVVVDDHESAAFPAGGFDAMSTKGTFENLVRSEVAYVGEGRATRIDDGVDSGVPYGPDLFDVRFVEGELLYYTRDESPLLEQKRALVFAVLDVERLRHKLPELPTQTLVLVLACCLRAHADLVHGLGAAAVHTTFGIGGEDRAVVDEEQGLLQTSLMADLAHRRVAVVDAAVDAGAVVARGRIVFSPRAAPPGMRSGAGAPAGSGGSGQKEKPARLWVRVGGARWVVDDGVTVDDVDAADLSALRAFVDRLLLLA